MRQSLLLSLAITFCAWRVDCQVSARQGAPAADPSAIQRINSPMVLEFPFPAADPSAWGKRDLIPTGGADIRRYRCDGVYIAALAVKVETKRKTDVVRPLFKIFFVGDSDGQDDLVNMRIELLAGDDIVYASSLNNVSVEEGKTAERWSYPAPIKADVLKTVTMTRVTLHVHPD